MNYVFIFSFALLLTGVINAQPSSADSAAKTTIDSSELYGLVPERPVKVGGSFLKGVANQHKYLGALRDAQGKKVSYERKGSCCAYPSENGFEGMALLDKYELQYRDADNKKQKLILYISFYDFEEPKAIKGFTLVQTGFDD